MIVGDFKKIKDLFHASMLSRGYADTSIRKVAGGVSVKYDRYGKEYVYRGTLQEVAEKLGLCSDITKVKNVSDKVDLDEVEGILVFTSDELSREYHENIEFGVECKYRIRNGEITIKFPADKLHYRYPITKKLYTSKSGVYFIYCGRRKYIAA